MCNAWNHPPGCTCGWGGEGHLGSPHGHLWHGGLLGDPYQYPALLKQIAVGHKTSFSIPTRCWYCDQKIYIYANESGSVVLFDEMGWPWPKHDCPNAPIDLKGQSLRRPTAFMVRMPIELSRWFQGVLESLESEGKDSAYAAVSRIPHAVLDGQYESQRPALEFLRHLSRANKLRRGIFFPFACASCARDVWTFVPTSGDPYVVEPREDGTLRHHHCTGGGFSKSSSVRASLPRTLSWREVESKLRADLKRRQVANKDEVVIGFVTAHNSTHLHIKNLLGRVIQIPSSIKHPIYTFVVSMPDPFNKGKFVIRAPTIEQFMHGLPSSLPRIVREATMQKTRTPIPIQPVSTKNEVHKNKSLKPATPKEVAIPDYPPAFDRPEVLEFLKTVTFDTLSSADRLDWRLLAGRYGWHLGGLIHPGLAQQFASTLQSAEQYPDDREKLFLQLREIGRVIALQVKRKLR